MKLNELEDCLRLNVGDTTIYANLKMGDKFVLHEDEFNDQPGRLRFMRGYPGDIWIRDSFGCHMVKDADVRDNLFDERKVILVK